MVAICDHLCFLFGSELEDEIPWKPLRIAPDLLVQSAGWHAIEPGEVSIDNDAFTADLQDTPPNMVDVGSTLIIRQFAPSEMDLCIPDPEIASPRAPLDFVKTSW